MRNTESSPNLVFFRRTIAGTNNAPNQFYRIVSWDKHAVLESAASGKFESD